MFKLNNNIYYKVGDKIVFDKIEAILLAGQTNQDITWHFHQDIYSKLNWSVEPVQPIDYFYRNRALQLREKYDYLVAMVSGGADSTNMVDTFLNNGIRLDEIVASAPLSGLSNYNFNDAANNAENTISETKYAQMPYMQYVSDNFPNVKLTINDYFDTILSYKDNEWLYNSSDFIHPSTIARYDLNKLTHLTKLAESGKKIGILYGIDKPILHISESNKVYVVFTDLACNVPRSPFTEKYDNVDIELFYWNDYNPQMMIKSAHQAMKWIVNNNLSYLLQTDNLTVLEKKINNSKYQRIIYPAIYPSSLYNSRPVFQASKNTRSIMAEHDYWMYDKHKDIRTMDMINSNVKSFFKDIDTRFLASDKPDAFKLYYNYYQIGSVEDFKQISI